ncbi:MAG: TorF family putative porin [Gammaproteobacteria bacterium]|nr:TorF family putative porin [Gammaproteobacteria bacterium]
MPLACALLALGAGTAAHAAAGGSLGVTSDYVLRGVSQSGGEPVLQADLHWSFPAGWSSGLWGSQLRRRPGAARGELGGYLQWQGTLSRDFDASAAYTHYVYRDDPRPVSYDYDEFAVSVAWRDQLSLAIAWTPRLNLYSATDGLASNRPVYTFEGSWHRTLRPRLELGVGLGFYDPQGVDYASYAYGNASLGWHHGHWQASLNAIWVQDAMHRQYSQGPAGGPLTATLAWSF